MVLYIVCVLLCALMIFPLLWGVTSSFRTDDELFKYLMPLSWKTFVPQNITFDAYIRIFQEFSFGKAIGNTVILMTFMIPFEAIALPLSVPVTISAALMIFISQWNSYLWPLIIGMSKDMQVIQTALGSFQQERGTLWSYLYAATAISAVIPLVIFLPLQKYYVEGITSSGVKG